MIVNSVVNLADSFVVAHVIGRIDVLNSAAIVSVNIFAVVQSVADVAIA